MSKITIVIEPTPQGYAYRIIPRLGRGYASTRADLMHVLDNVLRTYASAQLPKGED